MNKNLNEDVYAVVKAVVPDDQPGGSYREDGCLIIPVRVESVIEFNPNHFAMKPEETYKADLEKRIKRLQEIKIKSDMTGVPRGSKLTIELDENFWRRSENIKMIRTEPYAVEIRYEKPHRH